MGADADADTLHAVIDRSPVDTEFAYCFGADRVINFRAEDRLDISINDGLSADIFSVKDNIDSDGNGVVDAADDHVSRQGQSLVIDVRSLFQNEAEGLDDSFLGFSDPFDQVIALANVTCFDVDQLV